MTLDPSPGRLVEIVGEQGAGKSTPLRILAGDLAADNGTAECWGCRGAARRSVLHDAFAVEQHLRFFQTAYGIGSPLRPSCWRSSTAPSTARHSWTL
ncbi:ATP-binding cassette domain-containing protein [Streptomyces lateritius]|uniref:ATP-binding cassette domain-containing protein n=1 Tax=Streptomyces lateritius TaxID=67313 RepID=UPI001678447D|nr:hypothetical protein GCM10010272_69940 [Streptomyces lateritius]